MIGDMGAYAGYHLVEDPRLVVADWSGCRSPSRARRRYKRGFPQRVVFKPDPGFYFVGRSIAVHPATGKTLRAHLRSQERVSGIIEQMRRDRP